MKIITANSSKLKNYNPAYKNPYFMIFNIEI